MIQMRRHLSLQATDDPPCVPVWLQWLPSSLLSAVALILAALIIWGMNRGINFYDEGYGLLLISNPWDYLYNVHIFGIYLHALSAISPLGIVELRVLRLVVKVVVSVILSLATASYLKSSLRSWYVPAWRLIPYALLGSFTNYSIFQQTPSYNNLTDWLATLCFALGLWLCANREGKHQYSLKWFIAGLLGFGLSLLTITKISSALALGLLLILLLVVHRRHVPLAGVLSSLTIGGLLGLLVTAWMFYGLTLEAPVQFGRQLARVAHTLKVISQISPHHREMAHKIASSLFYILSVSLKAFAPVAAVVLGCRWLLPRIVAREKALAWTVAAGVATCVLSILAWRLYRCGGSAYPDYDHAFIAYVVLAMTLVALKFAFTPLSLPTSLSQQAVGPACWGLASGLSALLVAAGTGDPIYINAMLHLTPAVVAVGVVQENLARGSRSALVRLAPVVLLCALVGCHVLDGFLFRPFGQYPLLQATAEVSYPASPRPIMLSPNHAHLVEGVQKLLKAGHFQPGQDVLALYGIPALVYLVGGRAPGFPWISNVPAIQSWIADMVRSQVRTEGFEPFVVTQDPSTTALAPYLPAGLSFPNDFEELGVVEGFYVFRHRQVRALSGVASENGK